MEESASHHFCLQPTSDTSSTQSIIAKVKLISTTYTSVSSHKCRYNQVTTGYNQVTPGYPGVTDRLPQVTPDYTGVANRLPQVTPCYTGVTCMASR